jgi:hypothetical protein
MKITPEKKKCSTDKIMASQTIMEKIRGMREPGAANT